MTRPARIACAVLTTMALIAPLGAEQPRKPAAQAWVARSNQHAQVLLDLLARLSPEGAGQLGVEGVDDQITDLTPGFNDRARAALREASTALKARLADEQDRRVRQDLEIMLDAAEASIDGSQLAEKHLLGWINVTQLVFGGLRALLDDQVPAARRGAALVRLRKYAGIEPGTTPIATLAEQYTRSRLGTPGLAGPVKAQIERDLGNSAFFLDGIAKLFEKYGIQAYQEPYAKLKAQLSAYESFVRKELLPVARTDFRLPAEIYASGLRQIGVDIPAEELARRARAAFAEIQAEMQAIAPRVAKERGWTTTDYRDVIRELKKEQIVGDAILTHYKDRLGQIEQIIRREKLVTLPARPAQIRIASPAESAATPAPNMRPPRLLGNTGEVGEFVLPLNVPTAEGGAMERFDDFTFSAASWTLTAHEARPGHEMQFAAMIEAGVSAARAVFAFNSTNVEGWGLYSEWLVFPFMPAEGQLISLQHRLLRAARAYLDPELQLGKIAPEAAHKILREDVVLSNPMATQEVERYTFRSPGQATSYFYGYTRLLALRQEVEQAMGSKFQAQPFHDFILAQGLLPPGVLRTAVLERFVSGKGSGD
jgi:hypothetical protein